MNRCSQICFWAGFVTSLLSHKLPWVFGISPVVAVNIIYTTKVVLLIFIDYILSLFPYLELILKSIVSVFMEELNMIWKLFHRNGPQQLDIYNNTMILIVISGASN